jgi:hypothetical protein
MPAHRCTRHPEDTHRRNGRCQRCQTLARKRYYESCRDSRRRLRAIEAALAL